MLRYLTGKLLFVVGVLVVSSLAIYSALYLAPGDPISTLAGGRQLTEDSRAALEAEYNLDEPFFSRYADWLAGAVQGDFGRSVVARGQDVRELIAGRAGTSLLLIGLAAVMIVVVGIGAGAIAALRKGAVGSGITVVASLCLAIPSFVFAMLFITIFSVALGWFPVSGAGSGLLDRLWHLALPAASLGLASVAYVARITEVSVNEELKREHVLTAEARGLSRWIVVRRHVLRNAAIPITTAAGLMVAYLLIGAAVIEKAFALNGLGAFLVDSVATNDFAVVQAIALIVVVAFVLVNPVVDMLYSWLDPRIARK